MKIENNITTVQIEDAELKKVIKEFEDLHYVKIKEFYDKYPCLFDLLNSLKMAYNNRSLVVNRKINTY